MHAKPGDKVRLKIGSHRGERGTVERLQGEDLLVRLDAGGELVQLQAEALTNFSLAARKAWERMPERRVGRPKGSGTMDRINVTLRIDRILWDRFRKAEAAGLITDRTATINAWVSERLGELEGRGAATH